MMKSILSSLSALAILATTRVALADSIYIQIPGVPGESTSSLYPGNQNWSEINNVQFSVSRPVGSGAAGAGGITFAKSGDSTSPILFGKVVTGAALGTVKIAYARQISQQLREYQLIELQNPILESQSNSTSGERPQEFYSLFIDQIRISTRKFDSNGNQVGQPIFFPAPDSFHDFAP